MVREETLRNDLAPVLLKLTDLQDKKLAWERQQQEMKVSLGE